MEYKHLYSKIQQGTMSKKHLETLKNIQVVPYLSIAKKKYPIITPLLLLQG